MEGNNLIIGTLLLTAIVLAGCQTNNGNNIGMANPASVYCEKNGGTLEIRTADDGSQSGYCTLKSGDVCEEWAHYRGDCPRNAETFAVVKIQRAGCSQDRECDLPMYYAVQSNCPYSMKCIEGKCNVVCPYTTTEEYNLLHNITEADKKCQECPLYSPPSPDFCKDGKLIPGVPDECGCPRPATCEAVACTMDAKACPDGSYAGRVAPDCEFAPCPDNNISEKIPCIVSQRGVQACTMEYMPVCGWFDSSKIQCIKYPCAQTFGNKCAACADAKVNYWTIGECPNN
jgi:uncharacterized protein